MRLVGLSSNVTSSPWWICVGSCPAADLLDKDLAHVFRPEFMATVLALLQRHKNCPDGLSLPHTKTHGELKSPDGRESGQVLTCSLAPGGSGSTGVYLLEVELTRGGSRHHQLEPEAPAPGPGLQHVARMMRSIPVGSTPQRYMAVLCDTLKEVMPAYDRGMVYRFAADESGEVIHEATQPGSAVRSSLVGLRFPAGDVPPVAHEPSFKRNEVCFVADTRAQAVPVVVSNNNSCGKRSPALLDVSMIALRAPAARHRRYLRNMGVTANMAAAIVVQDELWGLFTFHGFAGRVVPTMAERIMVEIAAALSAKAITHHELERTTRLSRTLEHIGSYTRVQDFLAAEQRTLLSILELDSIVMWEPQESVLIFGNGEVTLSAKECESLVATARDGQNTKQISFWSRETRGVAFFSVRSFLLAFLRQSIISRRGGGGGGGPSSASSRAAAAAAAAGKKKEKPGPGPYPTPLWDDGRGTDETAVGWKPWSRRTVSLLGIMRHGLTSQLYAEALSADNMEMLAHVSHELRTPFHGVVSSLEALLEEKHSLGANEKHSILRSAMDAGDSM